MEGEGVAQYRNGDYYQGEFKQSSLSGYGCYTFKDGSQVIACFENGMV